MFNLLSGCAKMGICFINLAIRKECLHTLINIVAKTICLKKDHESSFACF